MNATSLAVLEEMITHELHVCGDLDGRGPFAVVPTDLSHRTTGTVNSELPSAAACIELIEKGFLELAAEPHGEKKRCYRVSDSGRRFFESNR
jgi:hypothetical protein